MALMRPNPALLDSHFLLYAYLGPQFQSVLSARTVYGSTVDRIPLIEFPNFPIAIPPLETQRVIAHILGTLDDKIELNRRMSETLEAIAKALFKSWFVDFDPVRAKMEGRWRKGETLPGLAAHLYDLFPERLVDSELGEIPEGWEVGTLGNVAEHPRRGVQPDSIEPDTPYIALEHMPRRSITLSEWSSADGLASNKFEFTMGEILFGKLRPYFHKVGVAPVNGICSTDIVVAKPRRSAWFGFVLGHMSSVEFVEYTDAGSIGTKMPRTSWADMARYEVVLPPEYVAGEFTRLVQPSIERIIAGIHESRTLTALRDALLPKLISGELRVANPAMLTEGVTP
jgi:type I restriction enzyme S subunit